MLFNFHPHLGKIPIFTNIFQIGWNHQLVKWFRVGQFLVRQKRQDWLPKNAPDSRCVFL